MSGPSDGKFLIQLAVPPKPFIGVDSGPSPVKPVITDGSDNVWTVTKLENGNYTLVLKEIGRPVFIHGDGGKLVGSDMPPPSEWTIQGEDGGPYAIVEPSCVTPRFGWTVNNPEPKSPVTINVFEFPRPNQLWNFIPVYED